MLDFKLVRIRWRQALREVRALGPLYTLLFLGLLAGAVLLCYRQFQQRPNAFGVTAVLLAGVYALQLARPDKVFVWLHLPHPRSAFFTEYLLLTLPFAAPALFTAQWYCYPALAAGLALLAGLRREVRQQTLAPWLGRVLPAQEFEWISGVRQNLLPLLGLYVLALGTCWIRLVPLVCLWLMTLVVSAFYQECEPQRWLPLYAVSAAGLLQRKLIRHLRLLLLLYVPVLALATVFHPELWWAHLGFLVLQLTVLAFAILLKYGTYEPGRKLTANTLLLSLAAASALLPFLLPLPLVMSIRNYGRARRRLHFYLHD